MKLYKMFRNFIILCLLVGTNGVLAAGIDHFEVTLNPTTAKVGEALDITITAVDKSNNPVTDYTGTILIFSETDPEAELPSSLQENTYTFEGSDQGSVTFENAIKFKNSGTQDLNIYDLNDDTVLGIGEAKIESSQVETNTEITIISPENNVTLSKDTVTVSGKTLKNYQVKVITNGEKEVIVNSNNQGLYETEITNLNNGENTFKSQILNADNVVIGESNTVSLKVESSLPRLTNIKISPKEVDVEGIYEIEVAATPGLTDTSVIINDVLIKLEETESGIYRVSTAAPQEAGVYKVDLILKDELNHETKELGAESITVKAVELASAEPEETKEETKEPTTIIDEKKELAISGLKVVELKTKSVLTWDEVEGAESYNVYKKTADEKIELIENVTTPKFEVEITGDDIKYDYFAVKAMAKTASGEIYEGALSDATKVKTGPEVLILLILSLFIGGFIFLGNKKKA